MTNPLRDFVLNRYALHTVIGILLGMLCFSFLDLILYPLLANILQIPDFSQMYHAFGPGDYSSRAEAQEYGPVMVYGQWIHYFFHLATIGVSAWIALIYMTRKFKKIASPATPGETNKPS